MEKQIEDLLSLLRGMTEDEKRVLLEYTKLMQEQKETEKK